MGLLEPARSSGLLVALYVIAVLFILFRWVQQDTTKRKAKFGWGLRIAMLALTALALPYYFFRSRGWRGGFVLLGQAWLIFIGAMLCYRIGYTL